MSLSREILSPVTTGSDGETLIGSVHAGLLYPALHTLVSQSGSGQATIARPSPCLKETGDNPEAQRKRVSSSKNTVICLVCGKEFGGITPSHLKKHNLTSEQYKIMFPEANIWNTGRVSRFKGLTKETDESGCLLDSSERTTKQWEDPEMKAKMSEGISKTKKRKFAENPEMYREMYRANGFKGLVAQRFQVNKSGDDEIKEEKSERAETVGDLWKDETYIEHQKEGRKKQNYEPQIAALEKYRREHPEAAKLAAVKGAVAVRGKKTKIQVVLEKALKRKNISFESEYPIYEAYCIPDIALPEKKIAVFCDGEHWHNFPYGGEKDKKQTHDLQVLGWKVLRFWGKDLLNNVDSCVAQIVGCLHSG